MMEIFHYPVFELKRIRYSFLTLDVNRGQYRRLTAAEVKNMSSTGKKVAIIGGGVAGLFGGCHSSRSRGQKSFFLRRWTRSG